MRDATESVNDGTVENGEERSRELAPVEWEAGRGGYNESPPDSINTQEHVPLFPP